MPGRRSKQGRISKWSTANTSFLKSLVAGSMCLFGVISTSQAQQSCQTNLSGRLLQNGYSIHTSYPFDPALLPGIPGTLTIKNVTGYGALHDVPAQRWETNQDGATPTVQTWVPADFDIGGSGPQSVFSTAIDPVSGDIYTASTRLWGTPTAPGSVAAPLSAGPMIVYRIDGTTGAVSQIVNITADVDPNENFGASYVTFDETNRQLFVVGMDTGTIYRIDPAGSGASAVLETYNPDIDAAIAEDTIGGELAPMGERILGLAWNPRNNTLYYSVWAVDAVDPSGTVLDDAYGGAGTANTIHNTIRSVALTASGAIDPASDQQVLVLPFLAVIQRNQLNEVNPGAYPNPTVSRNDDFSMPVADIQFNKKGDKALLAESGYFSGSPPSTLAHRARVLEYSIDNAGTWTIDMNQSKYGVGEAIDFNAATTYEGINARGGAAWAYHDVGSVASPQISGRDGYVLVTADALDLRATIYYGYQYMDTIPGTSGGTPAMWGSDLYESVVADLDGNPTEFAKGLFGDVDIMLCGFDLGDKVWYDTDQDGVQDAGETGVSGVQVELHTGAGCANPTGITATTDSNGNYLLPDIVAGDYSLQFSNLPAGYSYSPANQGGDDTLDSDADASGCIDNIALTQDDLNEDVGVFATGSITGLVWCESPTNANTAYDPGDGDTPQANVTVTLYEDSNCNNTLDGTEAATAIGGITGVAGNYTFTPLVTGPPGTNPPGCYVVEVDTTDPDLGLCNTPITPVQTFPDLTADNPVSNNNNFGLEVNLTLGDFVWYDTDQDGLQDAGEPGLNGINVSLYANGSCSGTAIATTVTANGGTPAADGWYEFGGLNDSTTYCVEFSGYPAAYSLSPANQGGDDSIDSDGIAGGAGAQIPNINLTASDPTNDLGLFMAGDISGVVWCEHSTPPNTSFDGAPDIPMSPIDVTLYVDANCNNVVDGAEAGSAMPQATTASGYSYTGLPVGPAGAPICYVVQVNATDPDLGVCNNPITATQAGPDLDVNNPSSPDTNFGFNEQLMLGDYVWYDNNQNGQQDAGEPGVNGVSVALYNNASCSGTAIATTVTANGGTPAADGWYNFGPLPSGNYCVEFSNLPAGWVFTQANQGNDATDSDADPASGQVINISLTNTDLTIDAGIYAAIGQVSGLVYCDENPRNGAFDSGEGRPNVGIDLMRDTDCDGTGDTLYASQDTDANGNYNFSNVPVALAPAPPNPQVCYVVVFDPSDPDLGDCDAPFLPVEAAVVLDTANPQPPAPIEFGVLLLPPEVIPALRWWGLLLLMLGLGWMARRSRHRLLR
jgi:hypothetical protein